MALAQGQLRTVLKKFLFRSWKVLNHLVGDTVVIRFNDLNQSPFITDNIR